MNWSHRAPPPPREGYYIWRIGPVSTTRLWRYELGLGKASTNPSSQCPSRYLNRTHQTYAALSRFSFDESAERKEMSNFCVRFKLRRMKTDRFYWILLTTQCVLCNSNASCRRSHYCNTRGDIAPRPSPLLILYSLCWWISSSSVQLFMFHYLPESREWP